MRDFNDSGASTSSRRAWAIGFASTVAAGVLVALIAWLLGINGNHGDVTKGDELDTTTVPTSVAPDPAPPSTPSSVVPTTTTTTTTTTPPAPLPDPGRMDAAVLAADEFGQLEASGWREWEHTDNTGLIVPDDPDVCSGEPDFALLAYWTYSGATETGPNGYAGSLLASFKGDGAAKWYDEMLRMATNCGGVTVNDQTGLTEVSDQSTTIHIPEGTSGWHDLWDRDIVVFRRGPVIGMVSQMDVANSQGGLRALALVLAQRVAEL